MRKSLTSGKCFKTILALTLLSSIFIDESIASFVTEKAQGAESSGSMSQSTQQQTTPKVIRRQISGNVKDTKGKPLAGVNITLKHRSTVGTTTDAQGNFRLQFAMYENDKPVLTASMIGMKPLEFTVTASKDEYNLRMDEEAAQLEDVVVTTGYQRISKREMASSIYTLKAEDVVTNSYQSIDQMLQGKVPGMMVSMTSGEPSAVPRIRIRGTSTINGNKSPIWVVDGVIMESPVSVSTADINSPDAVYLIGNGISGLSPQDIATIDVLKDASATAIYGVKAANGVIVITTKSGKEGKTRISYHGGVTIGSKPSYSNTDRMNSQQRIQLTKEMIDDGTLYPRTPLNVGYEGLLQQFYDRQLTEAEFIAKSRAMELRNTNWYDLLFRNAVTQEHQVTLSGGNTKNSYYASLGFSGGPGAALSSDSKRYNALMKFSSEIAKGVTLGLKLSGSLTENTGYYSTANPNTYAFNTSRTITPYNEDGSLSYYNMGSDSKPASFNILNELNETGSTGEVQTLGMNLDLTVKIIKGLEYQGLASYNYSNSNQQAFATERSYYIADLRGYDVWAGYLPDDANGRNSPLPYGGQLNYSYIRKPTLTQRNQFNYRTMVGDHSIGAMVGQEIRIVKSKGNTATAYGYENIGGAHFVTPVQTSDFLSKLLPNTMGNVSDQLFRSVAFYATADYSYKSRYVINGNIRWEGSNRFGTNPKYRFLPIWSIAGRWNISNETFMQDIKWLDRLAIRGSYGIQGNIDDNSSPSLVTRWNGRDNISNLFYSSIVRLPNPDLRWEKTKTYNVALEFTLWNNRISGEVEYYKRRHSDQIMSRPVSKATGRGSVTLNAGTMDNTGVEASISVQAISTKDWRWNVSANIARNKNKVKESPLSDASTLYKDMINGTIATTGNSLGTFYSTKFVGLSATGYPQFVGVTGDTLSTKLSSNYSTAYLVRTGSTEPDIAGGFDTRLSYKNITLTLGFSFQAGSYQRLPAYYSDAKYAFDPTHNVSTAMLNRWRKPGDEAFTNIPRIWDATNGVSYAQDWYDKSDLRVAKADFIRFRMLSLSYSFPQKLISKIRLSNLSVRFQANNLYVWCPKAWKDLGIDPETSYANIPILPSYNFGLDLTF